MKIKFRKTNKINKDNLCDAEISLDEIIKSINSETNNKPPGNDGLKAEFYKHSSNKLTPVLLDVKTPGESLTPWVLLIELE